MPLGTRYRGQAVGPAFVPRYDAPGIGIGAGDESDEWEHFTLAAALFAGGAVVTIDCQLATRINIINVDAVQLYVSFGDSSATAALADLLHPGGGELDRSAPPFRRVNVTAAGALTNPVHVWTLGGRWAVRPT